jgi:uncharacterized protein involved in exopolysaccharide biosynthesis
MTNRSSEGEAVIGRNELIRVVLAKWWLILLTTVIGASAAYLYSSAQPLSYSADAQVLLRPVLWSPLGGAEDVKPETEVVVATSAVVAQRAAQTLGNGAEASDLVKHVDVSVDGAGDVLDFSFSGSSARDSIDGATAFAQAYIDFRSEDAQASADRYRAPLESQISELDTQIRETRRELNTTSTASPSYALLLEKLNDAVDTRQLLRDQLAPLTSLSTDAGKLLGVAQAGSSAAAPTKQLALIVGAAFGMMIGIVLAFAFAKGRGTRADLGPNNGELDREAALGRARG